jgi:hypothetical protein
MLGLNFKDIVRKGGSTKKRKAPQKQMIEQQQL